MLKIRKMQGNRIRNIKSILAVFTFSFPPFLLAGAGLVSLSLSVATISPRIVFVDWKTEVISWRELFLKIRKYKKNETPCPTTQLYPNINKLQGMWHQLNNIGNPLVAIRNVIGRLKISIQLFVKVWNNSLDIWWKWEVTQWQTEGIARVAFRNWKWRQERQNVEQMNCSGVWKS